MMTKQQTVTRTDVQTTTLTSQEEKVVRMRHGLKAPAGLKLEMSSNPEVLAIERRAMQEAADRDMSPAKRRIISALRSK